MDCLKAERKKIQGDRDGEGKTEENTMYLRCALFVQTQSLLLNSADAFNSSRASPSKHPVSPSINSSNDKQDKRGIYLKPLDLN